MATASRDPAGAGRGRLRAGHADREHVVEALKTAFVVGRLTKDEFAARTGQALTARTYGDLAALTADLPAVPAVALPAVALPAVALPAVALPAVALPAVALPAPALRRPMTSAVAVAGVFLAVAVVLMLRIGQLASGLSGPDPHAALIGELLLLFIFSVATALSALGIGAILSVEQRRARRQRPPRAPGGVRPAPGPA